MTFSFQLGNFSIKARKSLETKVEIAYVFTFVVHIFLLFSTRTNFTFDHPMILHYSRECNGMELFLNSHLFNINALKFICDYRKLSTLMFGVEGGMDAYCSFTHIHYN